MLRSIEAKFPGCFPPVGRIAEKIPAEPDQDNTCEGRSSIFYYSPFFVGIIEF